jgi:AraC family L-rhamnose operon transcriptional activator RhaR
MSQPYRYARNRLFGEKGDPIVVQRVGMQKVFPPHEHDFIEIVLVVGGSGYQETAAKHLSIKRGTLTVLRPGHWHAYLKCRGLVIYNCCFGPELLRRELSWLIDEPKLAWLLWGKQEGPEEAGPLIFNLEASAVTRLKKILDDFRRTPDASYGMKISCLSLFLTTLAGDLPLSPGGDAGKMQPAVLRSIRLVEADLSRAWTIRDLARECGCSPEYLIRLFRTAIGMTPYAYINRCRAELAARLLLRTTATVAEIGEKVGWSEPCHFSRRFKRHYGSSATDYRAKMQS